MLCTSSPLSLSKTSCTRGCLSQTAMEPSDRLRFVGEAEDSESLLELEEHLLTGSFKCASRSKNNRLLGCVSESPVCFWDMPPCPRHAGRNTPWVIILGSILQAANYVL